MSRRWEYLQVVWVHSTNFATKSPSEPQTWESKYFVWRPGVEKDPEEHSGDLPVTVIFNGLGAEGWELQTGEVLDTTIFGTWFGWREVGAPIRYRWVFKREL